LFLHLRDGNLSKIIIDLLQKREIQGSKQEMQSYLWFPMIVFLNFGREREGLEYYCLSTNYFELRSIKYKKFFNEG